LDSEGFHRKDGIARLRWATGAGDASPICTPWITGVVGQGRAADADDEYHPLFFLDYICIVGRPLRSITRTNECFFDNVTVTFKDWQQAYTAKIQYKLPAFRPPESDIQAGGGIDEGDVVHRDAPDHDADRGAAVLAAGVVEEAGEIESAQHTHGTHARVLASYIKDVFLTGELMGERVEPSWTLNSPLSQTLTCDTWTIFQERFMEGWPLHVERHSYDF
jgi:hypothetical protein